MEMTKSNRGFFSNQGDVTNTNDLIWPIFIFVLEFIRVHLSCKFQEVLTKTEQVIVMTKPNRGFFSNQGDVTKINDPIWPVFELVRDLILVHLSASFKNIPSKLNKLH